MRIMKEFELQGHTSVHGIEIDIENKAGSIRSGVDNDGHEWSIKMNYDYGYIVGAKGKDKDEVDVYVGPNPESEKVFIVHQNDPITGTYDEDKVMLGFNSAEEAKAAYLSQYDRPDFFGTMDETDIKTFGNKVFHPDNQEEKLGILVNQDMEDRLNAGPEGATKENTMKKIITMSEDYQIPGTDIIVEKGEKIEIKKEAVPLSRNGLIVKQTVARMFFDSQSEQDVKESASSVARGVLEGLLEGTEKIDNESSIDLILDSFMGTLKVELKRNLGYDLNDF